MALSNNPAPKVRVFAGNNAERRLTKQFDPRPLQRNNTKLSELNGKTVPPLTYQRLSIVKLEMLGITPVNRLRLRSLQRTKVTKKKPRISAHKDCSNIRLPITLGIVPVSWLLLNNLQKPTMRWGQRIMHQLRCFDSQELQQRQLADIARDRADQSIVEQVPAINDWCVGDKTTKLAVDNLNAFDSHDLQRRQFANFARNSAD
jgi:hypothetical protein